MAKKSKQATKENTSKYSAQWLLGSETSLVVVSTTEKSVTLEVAGVSLGRHFGEVIREYKPS